MPCIGNFAIVGGDNTGEPFVIIQIPSELAAEFGGAYGELLSLDGSEEVTISISGNEIIYHKLPESLMPDVRTYFVKAINIGAMRHAFSKPEDENYTVGVGAFAEGISVMASGHASHAEGNDTKASGDYSHAEGQDTAASGNYSHAEGVRTTASGYCSHAEGDNTTASGFASHAEGQDTAASGAYSHAEGFGTIASGEYQHIQGKNNIEGNSYAHIIGNGISSFKRSNAHTIDWNGNAWFAGDVYVGSTSGINIDEGSKRLATIDEVNAAIHDKPEIATNEEIMEMFIQEDIVPIVTDADGSILTDEHGNILLW